MVCTGWADGGAPSVDSLGLFGPFEWLLIGHHTVLEHKQRTEATDSGKRKLIESRSAWPATPLSSQWVPNLRAAANRPICRAICEALWELSDSKVPKFSGSRTLVSEQASFWTELSPMDSNEPRSATENGPNKNGKQGKRLTEQNKKDGERKQKLIMFANFLKQANISSSKHFLH